MKLLRVRGLHLRIRLLSQPVSRQLFAKNLGSVKCCAGLERGFRRSVIALDSSQEVKINSGKSGAILRQCVIRSQVWSVNHVLGRGEAKTAAFKGRSKHGSGPTSKSYWSVT